MSMLSVVKNFFQVFMLVGIVAVFQNGVAGGSAETTKVIDALGGNDVNRVLSAINNAKELPYQGEMIQLMQALWNSEGLKDDISIDMIQKDVVRINVADFLVQANKNGLVELDTNQFQAYARKVLKSTDTEAVSSALFVLANIDDPEDVELIKPFVLSKSDYLFRSAALSLAMMCNDASDEALTGLSQKLKGSKRDYLRDTREKFLSMKEKGHYCR